MMMKKWWKDRRLIALGGVVILLFVLVRVLFFQVHEDFYIDKLPAIEDAPVYLQYAQVYSGLRTLESFELSPFTRTPVYPLFLARFVSGSTSIDLGAVFFVQQMMELVVVLLVMIVAWRSYSWRWGVGLALGLVFFFDFMLYGFLIRSEALFALLVLTSSLITLRVSGGDTLYWMGVPALLMGLATLTRPIALFACVPLVLMIWLPWKVAINDWSRRLLASIFILIVFLGAISPWMIRNYRLSGELVLQDDIGNLAFATFPGGHWRSVELDEYIDFSGMSKLERDQAITALAKRRIVSQPEIWIRNSLKNFLFRLWSMGFIDSHLRYFDYVDAVGGYHRDEGGPWVRLGLALSPWSDYAKAPAWLHVYFLINNVIGFSMIGWSLLSLVTWPFFRMRQRLVFLMMAYFWFITSLFAFSGSRYMVPMIPLLWLLIPEMYRVIKAFLTGSGLTIFPAELNDYEK